MEIDMHPKIIQFAQELTDSDPWQWRAHCQSLMNVIDPQAETVVVEDGGYYTITTRMRDGRAVEMGHIEGGFYIKYAPLA